MALLKAVKMPPRFQLKTHRWKELKTLKSMHLLTPFIRVRMKLLTSPQRSHCKPLPLRPRMGLGSHLEVAGEALSIQGDPQGMRG